MTGKGPNVFTKHHRSVGHARPSGKAGQQEVTMRMERAGTTAFRTVVDVIVSRCP